MSGSERGPEEKKEKTVLAVRVTEDGIPEVLAAGRGETAEAILRKAGEAGIEVKGDENLTRSLSEARMEGVIPPQLYEMIAEVLSFTYKVDCEWSEIHLKGGVQHPEGE